MTDPVYVDSTVDLLLARLNEQNAVDAERVEGDPRRIAVRFFDGQTVHVHVTGELLDVTATLRAVMVDPSTCVYCEGTGWIFLDKSYDGYAVNGGQPYIEPDDTNGGYEPCGRCNSDEEVAFGSGDKVKPWRRWRDNEIAEIAAALGASA